MQGKKKQLWKILQPLSDGAWQVIQARKEPFLWRILALLLNFTQTLYVVRPFLVIYECLTSEFDVGYHRIIIRMG